MEIPYRSSRGQSFAKTAHGGAGEGPRKKRTPSCNGLDRSWNITSRESGQTSSWSLFSKEWLENEVRPAVVEFLAERGLVLSPEKTKITHIGDGFDFLGWNLRKYNGKLLIKPSKANIRAHLAKLRQVIKTNKAIKQVNLIGLLNPILRGWANYHSHVVVKKVFNQVDSEVWIMLWRWAMRRHPRKGTRWVKDRYLKSEDRAGGCSPPLKNPQTVR
ncbi:group II intron maturase-specific domain-containing protein [Pseudomonas sp.]|uniref:group II intron maturase-specific domain-containing protein n=1 Tax=Pseudomonas sp. TaxID=306 RepID=UPI00261ECEAB|nr:group II intron maturase-specific domain-containing protein [Pseudomonas sp.]